MKFINLAMLARVFGGFVRDACVVDTVRRFELHAMHLRHALQAFIRSAGTRAENVIGQVHAFRRSIGAQIIRAPFHIHIVFSFQ